MKTIFTSYVILIIAQCSGQFVHCQSPSFKTYTNPVIPGDHPDATLTRIGKDFYTTGSSFNPTPVIYHSTDLVHWEAIAQPVSASWTNYGDTPGGGCWGGHMVYYNSKYWHYFSRAGSMYFVTALNPEGPWSQPVKVNNPITLPYSLGYDNSIFIDDDGKWYLIVKNGQPNNGIVELGDNGQPTGVVYNLNWLNPGPSYPYSWAEGPVMWKSFGYYYYSFARDLSGGQKVMRSPVLTAEQASWEMLGDLFNQSDPLKASALFTEPNHSSPAVMLDDSTFWVIHPLYAKTEWKGQGRQGLLNQVFYDSNYKPLADYPVNRAFNAPKLPSSGIPWMVPKSDFFTSVTVNPEWSFMGYTPSSTYSLSERPGWLRLSPKSGKRNILVKNDGEHNYSLITRVEFDAKVSNQEAGLMIIRGDETQYVKLFSSLNAVGQKIFSFTYGSTRYNALNTIGNIVWLKLSRVNHSITGYYSSDGINWTQIGNSFDISVVDAYSDFTSFTGTRQGLYVLNEKAFFDLYIYRDAYTPILAGWPANQHGTTGVNAGTLDNIHNSDWALYAGVEFGNSEYGKAADSLHIVASSTIGGEVEIWLDSIDTGSLIGTCNITPTGGSTIFKTFTAKVTQTAGRHDVYLRFSGTAGKLFLLRWIQFIPRYAPHFLSAHTSSDSTITVKLDKNIISPQPADGLTVSLNDTTVSTLGDVLLNPADSSEFIIKLNRRLIYADSLTLSYRPGNIQSADGLLLVAFNDEVVQNLIPDPTPYIVFAETNAGGDSIVVQFNKNMSAPDALANQFGILRNSSENLIVDSVIYKNNDSTAFICLFHPKVFFEDTLSLTYSGNSISSLDGNLLNPFPNLPINNISDGYIPELISALIQPTDSVWNMIMMVFDRPLADISTQKEYFSVKVDDQYLILDSITGSSDTIRLFFNPPVSYGDIVSLSYSGGNVASVNKGKLDKFTDFPVQNNIPSGIHSSLHPTTVRINPVPFKKEFTINSEQSFNKLQIYNQDGRIVFEKQYRPAVSNTRVKTDLPAGTYILVIRNGVSAISVKIVAEE